MVNNHHSEALPGSNGKASTADFNRLLKLFHDDFLTFSVQMKGTLSLRTISLFVRSGEHEWEILLGTKKRGHGCGKVISPGGKPQPGESLEQAQVREACEEIGLCPIEYSQVGLLDAYYNLDPRCSSNQRVVIYRVTEWNEVENWQESDEFGTLAWYPISNLPLPAMWPNEELYLADMINGKKIHASVIIPPGQDDYVAYHLHVLPRALTY